MKRIDYRHFICIGVTLVFAALGFVFPWALPRLWEAIRDFGVSVAYYVVEYIRVFAGDDFTAFVTPTVTDLSATGIEPIIDIPKTWELFKEGFKVFWALFFTKDNFLGFLNSAGLFFVGAVEVILLFIPAFICIAIFLYVASKVQNNNDNYDTLPKRFFLKVADLTYYPAKRFLTLMKDFLLEHKWWYISWILFWSLYFNLFAIVLEVVAYLLYLSFSSDFLNLYIQAYKLFIDVSPALDFIPFTIWISLTVYIINKRAEKWGYNVLRHNENKNRGFINERGVSTIIDGPMGSGKTWLATDMALSAEVQLRDQAYEIILESDMKFPNFPWINLERELKQAFEEHEIFSIPSCRRYLRAKYKAYRRKRRSERIWDYDIHRYPTTYNDGLKISNVWEIIDDYSCAYLVYIIESSLLVANYSIRVDNVLKSAGNFPLWHSDFFKRDPRLQDAQSRHAHILDFDMLRLGKTMLENNKNRFAFGFGVYVITELDKERKNQNELRDVKSSDKTCNQKNDLFAVLVKMSRHACIIANRVFVKFIADLQRTGDLSAGIVELGEVVHISSVGEFCTVLPFWAPYHIFEALYDVVFARFKKSHRNYRYNRSDNTLTMHLMKNTAAKMKNYVTRTNNTFGERVVELNVEGGKLDGEMLERRYYESKKKGLSDRFKTDCQSGIFEARARYNDVGIDDLLEYYSTMARDDELLLQHSFFQVDAHSYQDAA